MNRHRIIAAIVVIGQASHLKKVPEHPRNGHPVIEQFANIADGYSVVGSGDVTDIDGKDADYTL